jgi:predicted DNA-binding transcriptional regulator AlpA
MDNLLTVTNFCKIVGISRSTWHKLKRENAAPAIISINGIQRIRREAVEDWLAENEARFTANAAHRASEGQSPLVIA